MILSETALNQLSKQIHVLQQLQRLFTIEATLADVTALMICVEADYGAEARLEDVIQYLVARHLALQLEQRTLIHRYAS